MDAGYVAFGICSDIDKYCRRSELEMLLVWSDGVCDKKQADGATMSAKRDSGNLICPSKPRELKRACC